MEPEVLPFSERLQSIMTALKVKPTGFAKELEINSSSLSSLTGPRSSEPRLKLLSQIVKKYPRVSEKFLLTGEGSPLKPIAPSINVAGDGNAVAHGNGSRASVGTLDDCLGQLLRAKDEIIRLQAENSGLKDQLYIK
jgi:hypothetical protein